MIELGRSIVGEVGIILYMIGFIKKILYKKYYFVDGGMIDNICLVLY